MRQPDGPSREQGPRSCFALSSSSPGKSRFAGGNYNGRSGEEGVPVAQSRGRPAAVRVGGREPMARRTCEIRSQRRRQELQTPFR